jgi:hypothetical protein
LTRSIVYVKISETVSIIKENNMKKLITILLITALTLTIAGCTEVDTNAPVKRAQTTTTITTPTELLRDPSLKDCSHIRLERQAGAVFGAFDLSDSDMEEWKKTTDDPYAPVMVGLGRFDNESMKLSGVPHNMPIRMFDSFQLRVDCYETFHTDVDEYSDEELAEFRWHKTVFMKNGEVIERGYAEEGMIARVFHVNALGDEKFYGEYEVEEIRQAKDNSPYSFLMFTENPCFPLSKNVIFVKEDETTIKEVLDFFNEIEKETVELHARNETVFYPTTYAVIENGKKVEAEYFEESMVLRLDREGVLRARKEETGEELYGFSRFVDYEIMFV